MSQFIRESLTQAQTTLSDFLSNDKNIELVQASVDQLTSTFKNNKSVFSCGNGGSMCDANHFAEELTGRYRKDRDPLPAISICEPSHISCVANDYGYEFIFSRFIDAWAKPDDTLVAISTSGNSKNVIRAVQSAKKKQSKVIGLLGKDGGELKDLCDISIVVPSQVTDRIQEIHIKIIHILIEGIERNLFPQNYK